MALPSWAWPVIIGGGVVLVAGIWWFFFRGKPTPKTQATAPTSKTLEFWYQNGCGPCEAFKPTWAEFKAAYSSKIKTEEYSTVEDHARAVQRGVRGTPELILVYDDGTTDIYKGQRTVDAIAAWAGLV